MRHAREIWVQIIGQFERSGLTQERFAEDRGIPVATLRSWIYRLRREGTNEAPLLPVRVVALTAPPARRGEEEAGAVEIDFGGALRVRFAAGTPAQTIAELVVLLRDRC